MDVSVSSVLSASGTIGGVIVIVQKVLDLLRSRSDAAAKAEVARLAIEQAKAAADAEIERAKAEAEAEIKRALLAQEAAEREHERARDRAADEAENQLINATIKSAAEMSRELSQLRTDYALLMSEFGVVRGRLRVAEAKVEACEAKHVGQENEIRRLRGEVADKDGEIIALRARLDQVERKTKSPRN